MLHGHRSLLGRQPASEYWFDFAAAGDRILHSGKFNWTYVLGSAMMDPLYRGQTVIAYEGKNDAATWPRLIAKHGATIFIGVPTVYRQIIQKTDLAARDVSTLRHCMSAGEHLSDEVLSQWRERFGMDIYEAVGMSEFSYYLSQSTHRPIRAGSAGFPQPGHAIRLLDPETLREVAPGAEGMICVPETDPGLFIEYWNLPEETAKLRHHGWFFTGDYARYDEDGYIWFLGRKDDIIKSFGYRVSPYEVERVLKAHPAVADCACVGEEVERGKLLVVAYVIAQPGTSLDAERAARLREIAPRLVQGAQGRLSRARFPAHQKRQDPAARDRARRWRSDAPANELHSPARRRAARSQRRAGRPPSGRRSRPPRRSWSRSTPTSSARKDPLRWPGPGRRSPCRGRSRAMPDLKQHSQLQLHAIDCAAGASTVVGVTSNTGPYGRGETIERTLRPRAEWSPRPAPPGSLADATIRLACAELARRGTQ